MTLLTLLSRQLAVPPPPPPPPIDPGPFPEPVPTPGEVREAQTPRIRVFVRDANFVRIAELDTYSKLQVVLRFNDVSTWALDVPGGSDLLRFGRGLIVQRDDTVLVSGPIRYLQQIGTGDDDTTTASGPDDTVVLKDRLAVPYPAGPPYDAAAYDVRTAAAETVLAGYVDANAGPGAIPARRVAGLTLAPNQGRGPTLTGRARFDNLLAKLQEVALSGGGLGFRVGQVGSGLQFQVYTPTDRSATAQFSRALGNLRGFQYTAKSSEGNYVYVGGGGEGTERLFREGGDTSSQMLFGRIEQFRDRRDTTDTTELDQTIDEELARAADQTGLQIEPIDTPQLAFGRDYALGDRVTVVVNGQTIQDAVRQVTLTVTPEDGIVVQPVVGSPDAARAQILSFFSSLSDTRQRVALLERRQ